MIFSKRPEDFNLQARVTGLFIISPERKFLMLQRASGKDNEGAWGAPGGKAEFNEPISNTASREAREETQINPTLMQYWGHIDVRHERREGPWDFEYHIFSTLLKDCSQRSVILCPEEHKDSIWVTGPEATSSLCGLVQDMSECIKMFWPRILAAQKTF